MGLISPDGSRIAFAARRTVSGGGSNSDGSVELYTYDIPSSTFGRVTNVSSSSATADVVSSLSDDGSVIAFNFPRILSGALTNNDFANNSEIYVTGTPARPPQPRGKARGRPKDFHPQPALRHPVIRKTSKKRKKRKTAPSI